MFPLPHARGRRCGELLEEPSPRNRPACGLLFEASSAGASEAVLSGTTYRERIALPPGAVVEVSAGRLQDGRRGEVIAETVIRSEHQVPFGSSWHTILAHRPAPPLLRSGAILVDGRLSATPRRSVLTGGYPVDILLQRVSSGAAQPELGAYEGKVEGIREGLAALDRIEGSYTAGDNSVSYVAFVDGALPIMVMEHWDVANGRAGGLSLRAAIFISVHCARAIKAGAPPMAGATAP
jgi:uncharacterized lipoprotein YbaY